MSEWGPWVEHDGKGCPVQKGQLVEVCGHQRWGVLVTKVIRANCGAGWTMVHPIYGPLVVRYRIRKPRALIELIEMVENLPAPVGPKVGA